jgi:NAD(P)-dependent dehydrogenase (short-subunit alcohol dehydrogenase family)
LTRESRLQGKLALVTGVTSGIGSETVRALLAEGMCVWGVARDAARLAAFAGQLVGDFTPIVLDLADAAARARVFAELAARSQQTPVQLLVNNAAECVYESALGLPAARLARLFEINVTASVELCQALAPSMPVGAQIINLSSVVARHLPSAKFAPYAASKTALDCLTEALRLELHPRGVHVSTLAPGLVDTPIYDKIEGFERARQKLREQVPSWLTARDVAEVIVWMATRPPHLVVSELCLLPSAQTR